MGTAPSELSRYAGYCRGLRRLLANRLTLEESRKKILGRLETREALFLDLIARVWDNPASPYRQLMDAAGITKTEIEESVSSKGIEETLRVLVDHGVYVTVDEFKGRSPCRRNGALYTFHEKDFEPVHGAGFSSMSGGSRSTGTSVFIDFDHIEEDAVHNAVFLDVFGLTDAPCVIWFPAGLGLTTTLKFTKAGAQVIRWFTQVPWTFQMETKKFGKIRDRFMEYSTWVIGLSTGVQLPRPEYVPSDGIPRVVDHLIALKKKHGKVLVITYPSSALRAAKIARESGSDLAGIYFRIGGEPVTEAKRREIERSGARVIPLYASTETGVISMGCADPACPDDTHLLMDGVALVSRARVVEKFGVDVEASLVTTFSPHASKMLLNVETGDMCVSEQRSCGCGWDTLGFSAHIHTIRSFEKLTGEGMTILNSDLIRILEEVLPMRYGGSLTDYQLLEEEDRHGFTRIFLLVSPDVGDLDENDVLRCIGDELRRNGGVGGSNALSVDVWEGAGTFGIRREYPRSTTSGKILSFQVSKRP